MEKLTKKDYQLSLSRIAALLYIKGGINYKLLKDFNNLKYLVDSYQDNPRDEALPFTFIQHQEPDGEIWKEGVCPKCGTTFGCYLIGQNNMYGSPAYCEECGQMFDWTSVLYKGGKKKCQKKDLM